MSPRAPLKPCPQPGCPNLGECPLHGRALRRKAYDQTRGSSAARGYRTPAWRSTRGVVLERDPECTWGSLARDGAELGTCGWPSTDAAHIVPREKGGSDEPENLRGLCHAHHAAETSAWESWNRRGQGG